jgi:hypothetical protein
VASRPAWVRRWLDPRPALQTWRREQAARHRHITMVATTPAEPEAHEDLVGAGDRG